MTHIDGSLARGIRKAYLRRLMSEWERFGEARRRALLRNVSLSASIKTLKGLRERESLLERMLGRLWPATSFRIEANSRAMAAFLGLLPTEVGFGHLPDPDVGVRVVTLLQPGSVLTVDLNACISAHAIDRVIQRTGLVELPLTDADMQALNSEFSDLLPLLCMATRAMALHAEDVGDEVAAQLPVMLPAAHGVFLGGWAGEDKGLIVRTFVDFSKLNDAQLEAVREMALLAPSNVSASAAQALVPHWMNLGMQGLDAKLVQAWQHYRWRFSEEGLHPGLSDKAWGGHDGAGGVQ